MSKISHSRDAITEETIPKTSKYPKAKARKDAKKWEEKDRGITGNKRGIDYHINVAMYLCLEGQEQKLSNPNYEYKIQQEDEKAGMFDDIIYEYRENEKDEWTRLLIQIKNKIKTENSIKTSNLLYDDKKGTFNLIKYIKSIKNINNSEHCFFIIYTNASFEFEEDGCLGKWYKKDTKEQITLLPLKVSCISVFDSESQYKFNDETNISIFLKHTDIAEEVWTFFLDKLVFVVDQPGLEDIKNVVEEKIENILPKSTEKIRCKLLDKVDECLYNQKGITSEEISQLISIAQEEIQYYNENKYEESALEFQTNIPLYEFFLSENMILPIKSVDSEFSLHKVCKEIKKLREHKPSVNKYTLKHVYSIKEVTDLKTTTQFNLLIIIIKNIDQLLMFEILKNNDQKYIIIIPNDQIIPKMQNCHQIHEDRENTINMLSNDSKQYVLEKKCVLFNGQISSFSEILQINSTEKQVEKLNQVITEDVLKCFLDEDCRNLKISFNNSETNKLDVYIKRQLYYSVAIDEHKLKDFNEWCIIDNLNYFKTQCKKNQNKNIHHFKKYKNILIWNQTKGDSTNLRKFINKNNIDFQTVCGDESTYFLIHEHELCNVQNNTVVISDNPGMGKSLLMSSLFKNLQSIYPTNIIIRLNLNDHTFVFNEKRVLDNSEDATHFLKNKLLSNVSALSQNILNFALKNKNKIYLLLDGVDEVCPDYKDIVFKFIKSINEFKYIGLFVTTRPAQRVSLEEITSTFAMSLKSFTKEEQIAYLNHRLERKKLNVEKVLKNINKKSDLKELLGVPLLLKIITELLNNQNGEELDINEILNLSELFNKFVDKKFKIFSTEKKKQDETNISVKGDDEELQIIYKKKHEYLALKLLFGENEIKEKLDENTKNRILKIGIVNQIKFQEAEFVHRTFAEYFVSTYIQRHFDEEHTIILLFKNVLIQNGLTVLRKFINNYIQEKLNNDKETKAKYRLCINKLFSSKYDQIPLLRKFFKVVNDHNPLLSILFTAAIENNSETVSFILDSFADNRNLIKQMLSYDSDSYRCYSPIQTVIENGNIEIAKQLINYCFDYKINKKSRAFQFIFGNGDDEGNTALHYAAIGGHADIVLELLDKSVNIDQVNTYGYTALYWATMWGHTKTVQILLENGANINITDTYGHTSLQVAASEGHTDIVCSLLDKGADINIVNLCGNTILHRAVSKGHVDTVRELLNKGLEVNLINTYGDTPLHFAVCKGYTDIVRLLIDKNADVSLINKSSETLLYYAVMKGHTDIVSMLLDKGADTNVVNINKDGNTVLHDAAIKGLVDIVHILINKGADVNILNKDGNTVLHEAVSANQADIIRVLLDKGVDTNKVNTHGDTPLHWAVGWGRIDLVQMLLDKGDAVNIANANGYTALHIAAGKNRTDIVRMLLDKGADINITNVHGNTALHNASSCGNTDVVRELLQRGVDANIANRYGERALKLAYRTGRYKLVKLFLRHFNDQYDYGDSDSDSGSNIDDVLPSNLHHAVWRRNATFASYLLNKSGNVNVGDSHNRTPLYWAALHGYCDMLRVLLNGGADANIRDINGCTVLQAAFRSGNYKAVQVLFKYKRDVYDDSDSD